MIYSFFTTIFDWITILDRYNIFDPSNTIIIQSNKIVNYKYDINLLISYILSIMPKLIIPLLFFVIILFGYCIWYPLVLRRNKIRNVKCIYFHFMVICIMFSIFALGLSISILNNIYEHDINYDVVNDIKNIYNRYNMTIIEITGLITNTTITNNMLYIIDQLNNLIEPFETICYYTMSKIISFIYIIYLLFPLLIFVMLAKNRYKYVVYGHIISLLYILYLIYAMCFIIITIFYNDLGSLLNDNNMYNMLIIKTNNIIISSDVTFSDVIDYYYKCNYDNPFIRVFDEIKYDVIDVQLYDIIIADTLINTNCSILTNHLHNFINTNIQETIYLYDTISISYIVMLFGLLLVIIFIYFASKYIGKNKKVNNCLESISQQNITQQPIQTPIYMYELPIYSSYAQSSFIQNDMSNAYNRNMYYNMSQEPYITS